MNKNESKIQKLIEDSFLNKTSDIKLSISHCKEALLLCKLEEYDHLKAKVLSDLASLLMVTGEYDQCFNHTQKSIQIYEKLGDEMGIAGGKYNLAGFYFRTNNFQLSVVNVVDALSIYRKFTSHYHISSCEKLLGAIYQYIEDESKAIESFNNGIQSAKLINNLNLESNIYNNLSSIYLKQGNVALAEEVILKSISSKEKTKDLSGLGFAIYGRGKINFYKKDYEKSEADFLKAISIHEEMHERLGASMAYNKLAHLYLEINTLNLAKHYSQLGLKVCEDYAISLIKHKLIYLNYLIYKAENNTNAALESIELYLKEKDSVFCTQNIKIVSNYDLIVKIETMKKESDFQFEKSKLIAKNNKIKEVARIRQEFLSNMSHEIRTPLNAVTTIATILSEDSEIKDKVLVDSLRFSSNHLMQIINDILDFTKLDLGKMQLNLHPVNIKSYLRHFWQTYEIQTRDKQIEFSLKIDENLFDAYLIDETKTTQILGNLVSNAIKFTEVGEVILEIAILKQEKEKDTLLIKISDTGIGIEKENIEKVFENFSQLKSGITRKKDGTGLGLTITKKLIELYGSEIKIKSEFGKGAVFSFELKLTKSTKFQSKIKAIPTQNEKLVNVLLAEDNSINALIAIKLLSKWGINIDHAKNGLEAFEMAKIKKYNYILMDIHMPVLDGYQAARTIRKFDNLNMDTPILGLTADIAASENKDYNLYFNDFYLKPLEIEKLRLALNV